MPDFIDRLAADLARAVSTEMLPHDTSKATPRRWWPRPHRRVVLVPALLLCFAAAAVAATVLNEPTPTVLVADGLSCMEGTVNHAYSGSFGIEQRGSSPTAACGKLLKRSPSSLVACYNARFGVNVYESNGAKNQCAQVKMHPLPAGYAAATARIYRLQLALNRLYNSQDCISPTNLASQSQQLLHRSGFVGWGTQLFLNHGQNSTGPCGTFLAGSGGESDATAALNGRRDVVEIYNGPSRSVFHDMELTNPLLTETGTKCFTTSALEKRIEALYKPTGLRVRFAITQEPRGEGFGDGRQPRYEQNCTIFTDAETAPDGHTLLVWLNSRKAPPLPYPGPGAPSTGSYKPGA